MKRTLPLFVAVLLVGSLFAAVPVGGAAGSNESETLPGERFAGVVGTQEAELDGELESRAFGIAVANADSDAERAELVAERLDRNEARLADIDARYRTLRQQRDNGAISEGTYRAKVTVAVAEASATNRTTNEAADVSAGLPENVRAEYGTDDRVRTLQRNAADLTGPEVADIARDIAGSSVGAPLGPDDRPERPPGAGPNGTDDRTPANDRTPTRADG
jgi:hypothetical protein